MKLDRRSFIRSIALAGSGLVLNPMKALSKHAGTAANLFCVHPFVQDNPDAVFIMKTNVDVKTNAAAMKEAGLKFADSVLGLTEDQELGIPLTNKFVFKPNLTCRASDHSMYTIERSMGIVTDSNFMEGIVESMQKLDNLEIYGSQDREDRMSVITFNVKGMGCHGVAKVLNLREN